MDQITAELTIFFEEPFWVGVYQRLERGKLTVNRQVFGAQPKDYEVYEVYLRHWNQLRFSPPVAGVDQRKQAQNPKRRQRQIQQGLATVGVGTKAQQAMKLLQEQKKEERLERRRQRAEDEKERRFSLRQLRKKERHRGH